MMLPMPSGSGVAEIVRQVLVFGLLVTTLVLMIILIRLGLRLLDRLDVDAEVERMSAEDASTNDGRSGDHPEELPVASPPSATGS